MMLPSALLMPVSAMLPIGFPVAGAALGRCYELRLLLWHLSHLTLSDLKGEFLLPIEGSASRKIGEEFARWI